MTRTLDSYTLGNLYELEAQGAALLPALIGADVDRMADLLAAQAHHTFPRIYGRRG